MTTDEIQDSWRSQEIRQLSGESLEGIIAQQNAGQKRQLTATVLFAIAAFAVGIFNFLGQYFGNGNGLFISVLRALPVLSAAMINIVVVRQMAKEKRQRIELAASHQDWLNHRIKGLEEEIRGGGWWKMAAFFTFLLLIVGITKWLDFQNGEDSLAECIGIVTAVLLVCVVVLVGVWHHKHQFLIPDLIRFRNLSGDLLETS